MNTAAAQNRFPVWLLNRMPEAPSFFDESANAALEGLAGPIAVLRPRSSVELKRALIAFGVSSNSDGGHVNPVGAVIDLVPGAPLGFPEAQRVLVADQYLEQHCELRATILLVREETLMQSAPHLADCALLARATDYDHVIAVPPIATANFAACGLSESAFAKLLHLRAPRCAITTTGAASGFGKWLSSLRRLSPSRFWDKETNRGALVAHFDHAERPAGPRSTNKLRRSRLHRSLGCQRSGRALACSTCEGESHAVGGPTCRCQVQRFLVDGGTECATIEYTFPIGDQQPLKCRITMVDLCVTAIIIDCADVQFLRHAVEEFTASAQTNRTIRRVDGCLRLCGMHDTALSFISVRGDLQARYVADDGAAFGVVVIGPCLDVETVLADLGACSASANLRFRVGSRVTAAVDSGFALGRVIALWDDGNPYRIRLDRSGQEVWAPVDSNKYVRAA